MHGRPMLGKHRMVTVATRIEPPEVERLKELAAECDISVCAYLRDLIRMELGRADRAAEKVVGERRRGHNGDSSAYELAV